MAIGRLKTESERAFREKFDYHSVLDVGRQSTREITIRRKNYDEDPEQTIMVFTDSKKGGHQCLTGS